MTDIELQALDHVLAAVCIISIIAIFAWLFRD